MKWKVHVFPKVPVLLAFLLGLMVSALTKNIFAADVKVVDDESPVKRQLKALKANEAEERSRLTSDEKLIKELEQRLDQLDARNQKLEKNAAQVSASSHQLQTATTEQIQTIQRQIADQSSPVQFNSWMNRYFGQHQFTFAGAAAGDFIYSRQTNQNTFALVFEPLVLYRLNDWMLFEAEIEAGLPQGSSAEFALPVATAQIFLNDYVELVAGLFDQPFGDFYEAQSPLWVNRLVTAPLPYGAEALIPPSDLGLQLRGSTQWGELGQDVDYTVWVANGPSYDTSLPQPVVGATLESPTNIGTQSHGRAYGARFRIYPLPLDTALGRLELGASTYNGKWLNGNWLNGWGIDFAYLRGNLQARGEFLEAYRQMPAPSSADNRQGWYVQAGYFLQGMPSLHLGDKVDETIRRLEGIVRYSGVNQRAIVNDEIQNTPELGFNGSPSIFSPHAREVALGLDYWIEPSIVWQTEFDFELPRSGGTLISFNGSSSTSSPVGSTPNDRAILTQLAIGF
jgi:hypothetical protein